MHTPAFRAHSLKIDLLPMGFLARGNGKQRRYPHNMQTYESVLKEIEAEAETRRDWLQVQERAEYAWWALHDLLQPGPALEAHLDLREALWRAADERVHTITIEEYNTLGRYARHAATHIPPWLTPIPGPPARGGS